MYKSSNNEGSEVSIFTGLFFAAPINSVFFASTYIWPEYDEQLPQSLADEYFERFMPLPKLHCIKKDNADFTKHFCVYTTNPFEANSIVDTEMMERMVHFKKQINRETRFSFVEGVCYVAIAVDEDLLEPSVSEPGNRENIKEYFLAYSLS